MQSCIAISYSVEYRNVTLHKSSEISYSINKQINKF